MDKIIKVRMESTAAISKEMKDDQNFIAWIKRHRWSARALAEGK
jgi:hypothetical protein